MNEINLTDKWQFSMTPWFEPDQKPVRVGVYQTRLGISHHSYDGWCYWNGLFWAGAQGTKRAAEHYKFMPSIEQDRQWRGIVKAPV